MRDRWLLFVSSGIWLVAGLVIGVWLADRLPGQVARAGGDVIELPAGRACYDNGTCIQIGALPSVTPTPTSSPTSSPAPATATPSDVDPTPTPDTLPTVTPAPGPTQTPTPASCAIKINGNGIRLRSTPGTGDNNTIVDVLEYGTIQTVYEFRPVGSYLWARNDRGWFAVRDLVTPAWWVFGVDGMTESCVDVAGWPSELMPPDPIVRSPALGIWSGPGASKDDTIAFITRLTAAGITPAVTIYGDPDLALPAHQAGAIVLARPFIGDCPDMTIGAVTSAHEWTTRAIDHLAGVYYDWLVLSNECVWPSPAYAASWIGQAVDTAAALGVDRLVPVVWPPGWPEFDQVDQIAAVYADAPILLGWGMNLYPVEADRDLASHGGISEYTVWRYKLYRHQIPDGVALIVTEAARGDGAQRAVMEDIARFVELVGDDLTVITFWYNATPAGLGHWPAAVLAGRLGELAGALIAGTWPTV